MPGAHKCHLCDKAFKQNYRLKEHFFRVHTDEKPYSCDICNASYKYKYVLDYHLKGHATRPFQCHICKKFFSDEYRHGVHVRGHTDKRPHHCALCDSRFRQTRDLVMHVRFYHSDEKPHQCELCDYRGAAAFLLKQHFRRWHAEVKFRCSSCRRSFGTQAELDSHVLALHKTKCDVCGKVFRKPSLLARHAVTHTDESPYECEVCHQRYRGGWSLLEHLRKKHGKRLRVREYRCEKCFKSFPGDSELNEHSAVHENVTQFKCDICQSYFKLRIILKHHLRTHVGEHASA